MKITYFTKDDMIIVEDDVEEIVIEQSDGMKGIQDDTGLYHIFENKQ